MIIIGYLSAVIMGFTLGLIGGGGSILTLPILVYIFKIPPVTATAYSLFIVGLTSLISVFAYTKDRLVQFKTGVLFAIPAMCGVFIARRLIVPSLPDQIIELSFIVISKDAFIMIIFAIMMLFASISMIKKTEQPPPVKRSETTISWQNLILIILEGSIVGLLTGLVGAGGGFLVIPVLVLLTQMEMKEAIATSLLIIAIKSLFGFLGDLSIGNSIDWRFLFKFSLFTIVGAGVGIKLSKSIPGKQLKVAFGWFVLFMGIFVLISTNIL